MNRIRSAKANLRSGGCTQIMIFPTFEDKKMKQLEIGTDYLEIFNYSAHGYKPSWAWNVWCGRRRG